MRPLGSFVLIAVAAAGLVSPALADRGPNKEGAQIISAKLTAAGFKSWNKIEYDPDGHIWKIDDARAISGKTFDVQLNHNYEIVKKDSD